MRATGIVRRIDDLGRLVIPREIRRTMKVHEGDAFEIYTTEDGEVVLKKYQPMPLTELEKLAQSLSDLEIDTPRELQEMIENEKRRLEE